MFNSEYPATMACYNRWMNQRLYQICDSIADAERKKDCGAFFKSIHGTLNHLLLADRLWLGRFQNRPFSFSTLDQELYSDFAELCSERDNTDAEIINWANSLTPEHLSSEFNFISVVASRKHSYPLWVLVTHFFNHQTHHRGQLTTLLSQQGIDPGITDLMWLPGIELLS